MKYFLLIFFVVFAGCKAKRISKVEYKNDSIQIEKIVSVMNPADSANIRALLECDKNGKVILRWLDEEISKNAELRFKLDSLGNLSANFKSGGDSIKTSYIDRKILRTEKFYLSMPAEISKWNRWMINLGYCFLGIISILILFGILKLSKKIKIWNIIPFI